MKKFLLKIMTVILTVAMLTGTMASCGLFEVDTDRDLERAVAKVDIGDGIDEEFIYKRELISGFMSYGYMYVQNYGYSVADTYNLILDNLINNKVIMQHAKVKLAADGDYKAEDVKKLTDDLVKVYGEEILAVLASDNVIQAYNESYVDGKKDSEIKYGSADYTKGLVAEVKKSYGAPVTANDHLFRFLDYETVVTVIADTIDSVNSLIESFMEEEHVHEHENVSYTVRTTPTMEEEEDEALTEEELKKLTSKTIKLDSKERKTALADAYERFVELGLVDSHEQYDVNNMVSILNLTYFRSALIGSLESEIITKFEDILRDENKLTKDDANELWDSYKALAKSQANQYEGDVSGLESALSAISDSTFVTYNPGEGYGYVSHFLLQYDEDLKAELDEKIQEVIDSEGSISNDAKADLVDEYAQKVTATDLRASWVQSGYGVLEGNQKVKFTSDYVYTDVLAYYDGTYEKVSSHEEEDEDGNKVLSFNYYGVEPIERDFAHFNSIVNSVIGATVEYGVAGQVEYNDDLKNRFEDLKFAYSTDEGNFNSYLGYLYSPITSDTQYVSAFAEASKIVCEMGAGAYMMFGSYEYGLHIVLCTKVVSDLIYTIDDDAGKVAFIAALEEEGSVAYNFLEATNALLESSIISKLANTYIQDVENVSEKYEKVYKDLVEESEE